MIIPRRFEQAVVKVAQAASKQGAYIPTPKQAIYPVIYPKRTKAAQAKHKTAEPLPLIGRHYTQEIIKSEEPTLTTETDLTTIDPLGFAASMLFGIPGIIAGAVMGATEGQPESTKTTITGIDQIEPETWSTILPSITPDLRPPPSVAGGLDLELPGLPSFDLSGITPYALLGGAAILAFILLRK